MLSILGVSHSMCHGTYRGEEERVAGWEDLAAFLAALAEDRERMGRHAAVEILVSAGDQRSAGRFRDRLERLAGRRDG